MYVREREREREREKQKVEQIVDKHGLKKGK